MRLRGNVTRAFWSRRLTAEVGPAVHVHVISRFFFGLPTADRVSDFHLYKLEYYTYNVYISDNNFSFNFIGECVHILLREVHAQRAERQASKPYEIAFISSKIHIICT